MYRIRKKRLEAKMSQKELAQRSGVKQSVISFMENGVTKAPRIDTMTKLAAALGCTLDELVREEGRDG